MTGLPDNLVPLPTQPWETRPAELPIDREEARTAIWKCAGNVTKAAKLLKVSPSRLRNLVKNSEYLQAEVNEAKEQMVDKAEDVVWDALDDPERCDQMARFVLQTQGKHRGWGNGAGKVEIDNKGGTIVFQWADGTSVEPQKVIEGEVIDG